MWRFFKTVPRAIRQQWNTSVRSAPQTVHCEDEPSGINKSLLVRQSFFPGYKQRWQLGLYEEDPDRERYGRRRTQRCTGWTTPNCQQSFLEAVGWGTAILLGLQLSRLYHLKSIKEKRQSHQEDDFCPIQWLHKLAAASNALPRTSSYVSLSKHCNDEEEAQLLVEEADKDEVHDGPEVLDYESLLDIEVRSLQCDCSLQCESHDVYTAKYQYDIHDTSDKGETTEDAKMQPEIDPSKQAEAAFKEAVDEWCTLSNRCAAKVHHQFALHQYHTGNTQEAFKQWQLACLQGDSSAHFNLALCYELGKGTSEDPSKAVEHYSIAAAGGHHKAMYNLAVYYLVGMGGVEKDVDMAIILLEKAASEGLSQAQTDLGVLLSEERGDWHEAADLFSSAARQNDISAKYYLGVCHENGWGVTCDAERAAELYSAAASVDHSAALHSLATFKEKGRGGMPVDRKAACELYKKAAGAGHQASEQEYRRLTAELNQERFESELRALRKSDPTVGIGSRRSKSSPVLTHSSLSFYIRENLLDFGLDDLHPPVGKVTFLVGDDDPGDTSSQPQLTEPTDNNVHTDLFKLTGGFGDIQFNKKPNSLKPTGNFGNFNPKVKVDDFPSLAELEYLTELQMVVCS